MSYDRGWAALHLDMPPTIPHTEYCSHPRLVKAVTGLDPREDGGAWSRFYEMTDYDLLFGTNDGPAWQGRTTNMGHAVFQEGGTDYDDNVHCPFGDPEDVLSFDPVEEYGLPDLAERTQLFEHAYQSRRQAHPTLVTTGGYYKTLVSACIAAFGWEMFLTAAPLDYQRFDQVLEGFFRISMANFQAWAQTSAPVFICHDDMVWTEGAIFHPDWYRRCVFPRYRKLWSVLKEAGKIVLFCSDGDYTEFVDDIAEAGADGFIFEPLTSLERVVEGYGQTKVIIGNADCRILTFGTCDQVRAEVQRCADLGRDCPGYFFAVGNHIPHNVPLENALYYLELIQELGQR
ncbi:MAG: uroporphyrinogen decarboxylase family protein [Armatimonadota bacterium]